MIRTLYKELNTLERTEVKKGYKKMMEKTVVLYTDGGVIGANPSMVGGTYAYVLVKGRKVIHQEAGVYTPHKMGTSAVTNNQMELLAVVRGLLWAEDHEINVSVVYSDSQVTLGRVFYGWRLKNIPIWMIEQLNRIDLTRVRGEFVRGHNGDKWNEMCDRLATEAGQKFLDRSTVDSNLALS